MIFEKSDSYNTSNYSLFSPPKVFLNFAYPTYLFSSIVFTALSLANQHYLLMEQLLTHITNYAPLSTDAQNALQDCFEQIIFSKNEYLLTEGQVCRHLYFLEKGALRGFYNLMEKK